MSDPKKTTQGWAQKPLAEPDPNYPQQVYPQPGYPQPPVYQDPYQGQYAQQPDATYPAQYPQPQPQDYAQYPQAQPQDYAQYPQAQPQDYQQPYYQQPPQQHPYPSYQAAQYQVPVEQPPPQQRSIPHADATVGVSARVRFIRLTYLHLLLAILAFAGLEYLLMTNPFLGVHVSGPLVEFALGVRWHWGVVLAVFMAVSWVADYWASHATSKLVQYMGLLFYICAEALIFVPLLAIVEWKTAAILSQGGAEPHIIRDSAFVTMAIFVALTLSVFISKKDFSFMRSGLMMAGGASLTLIFLSLSFGFNLGLIFSVAMVVLAGAYILYQTSQVLAHYDPHQHVAAALALF
ncbi:MAG TPA: Bax inhibitor-1 family protein, partial [Kofleriaceae bacterium]|nr:Bax inhibitor-1 family protein [Kofleriaceae bacterium]